MNDRRSVVIAGADLMARARVEDAARRAGLEVRSSTPEGIADAAGAGDVALVVIDLDRLGADALERLAASAGLPRVVGYFSHVDADLGRRAEAAGCEAYPRGRFWRTLPELLDGA